MEFVPDSVAHTFKSKNDELICEKTSTSKLYKKIFVKTKVNKFARKFPPPLFNESCCTYIFLLKLRFNYHTYLQLLDVRDSLGIGESQTTSSKFRTKIF